jgi:hypothetical protein
VTARFTVASIHPVADFDRWKEALGDALERGFPGLVRRTVFRSLDDPNEVMVELELESAEAALALIPSLPMREMLDRGGVDIYPAIFVGEEVSELGYVQ